MSLTAKKWEELQHYINNGFTFQISKDHSGVCYKVFVSDNGEDVRMYEGHSFDHACLACAGWIFFKNGEKE